MRWYAKLANGDVEAMTLDELDVAYENCVIDAGTLVLAPEATDWVELGELAGLGESPALGPPAADDTEASFPLSPPRPRSKWRAPLVFAGVIAAAFVAVGFEAQQAGAFSHHQASPQEALPSPHAPLAAAPAPSAVGAVGLDTHSPRPEPARRSKPSPPRAGGGSGSSAGEPKVFTSGGDRYDPLNADLP
jgi:hypothetical protein